MTRQKIELKKYAYLLFILTPLIPLLSMLLGMVWEAPNIAAYAALLFYFGVVPLADWLVGKDSLNPDDSDVGELSNDYYYKLLTLLCVPIQLATIIFGAWHFSSGVLNLWGQIGWILNIGFVGGVIAINVAHELIHKNPALERFSGGLLLSMVCYGGFKVEHLRGHHVHVSTPEDPSSAEYNQSLYNFLPKAYYHNITNAWRLEAKRLRQKGKSPWSWSNELVLWYGLSAGLCVTLMLVFGWQAGLFFLGQSLVAFTLLEIINYVEHYGLRRKSLENGRYERVTHHHSWNSNFFVTNMLLLQLQRHSDHHAFPKRRYQVLRHFDDSPQLPAGYATMIMLAVIPPLWKKVVNPIIDNYYAGEGNSTDS